MVFPLGRYRFWPIRDSGKSCRRETERNGTLFPETSFSFAPRIHWGGAGPEICLGVCVVGTLALRGAAQDQEPLGTLVWAAGSRCSALHCPPQLASLWGRRSAGGQRRRRGQPHATPGPEPEALMLAAPLWWCICGDGDRVPGGRGAAAAGRRALPRGSRRRPDARGAQSPRPSGVGRSPGRRTPPLPRPPHRESKTLGTGCAATFSSTAESLVRSDATAAPLPTDPLG